MILICGTIPKANLPITIGKAVFQGESLNVGDVSIPCTQGTAALISAACVAAQRLGTDAPQVLLVGDEGTGKGSRQLYDYLTGHLPVIAPDVLLLHYILPVMGLMKKVCEAADKCRKKPMMIADASSMYAAKAAGLAPRFDIFTPDFCELAFLADSEATHPAYISRHLFCSDIADIGELISAAYAGKNAASMLVVKGKRDYIVENGSIVATVSDPDIPVLEAIGGTGDTITGMIGAFVEAGIHRRKAALMAATANRFAGRYAAARPSTKIRRIVEALDDVLKDHLRDWLGADLSEPEKK